VWRKDAGPADGAGLGDIVAAHPSLVGCPAAATLTPITAARPDTGAAHGVIAVILRFTVGTPTDFGTSPLYQCGWSVRSHVLGQNDGAPDVGYRPSNLFAVFPSSPPSPVPSWERAALSIDRTSSLDEHDVFGAQLQSTVERLTIPLYAEAAGDGLVEDHSLLPPKFEAPSVASTKWVFPEVLEGVVIRPCGRIFDR
jgi:hypothetical protein